jgi:hypothetical protein
LKNVSLAKISSTLKKNRSKNKPKCESAEDLEHILRHNSSIKEMFSTFRDSDYYRGIIHDGSSKANLFIAQKLVDKMEKGSEISVDGTFSVVPKGFKQLLIIFGEIDGIGTPIGFALMTSRKVK